MRLTARSKWKPGCPVSTTTEVGSAATLRAAASARPLPASTSRPRSWPSPASSRARSGPGPLSRCVLPIVAASTGASTCHVRSFGRGAFGAAAAEETIEEIVSNVVFGQVGEVTITPQCGPVGTEHQVVVSVLELLFDEIVSDDVKVLAAVLMAAW